MTLNKQDFKKYLLEKMSDSRQEELIFWKNRIPLPIDLVYKIFDQRGELLKIYLDHISSFSLYAYATRDESSINQLEANKLPSSLNKSNIDKLKEQFEKYYNKSKIIDLTRSLANKLFIEEYKFSKADYLTSLCHEGRKYKRFYLPLKIKEDIGVYNSELLNNVGVSNGDMFGNIVADELGVYRSGFSDAFSAIFNKLLDFILESSVDGQISISAASKIKISQANDLTACYSKFIKGKVVDGSLWEPLYSEATSSFILNERHPYVEFIDSKTGIEVLIDIASQFAIIESETVKDSTNRMLEILRQDISRKLRLISEKN